MSLASTATISSGVAFAFSERKKNDLEGFLHLRGALENQLSSFAIDAGKWLHVLISDFIFSFVKLLLGLSFSVCTWLARLGGLHHCHFLDISKLMMGGNLNLSVFFG